MLLEIGRINCVKMAILPKIAFHFYELSSSLQSNLQI